MWGRPALIGLLALFPAPSLASETQPFQIGPWRGGAYADNASGRFSHCSAGAAFGRALLSFSMTRGGALSVDLSDPDLRPSYGEQTEMDISFDRGEPFRAMGQGAYNGVSAALLEDEGAAEALRSGSQMHVVVLGSRFNFDLTSAPELLSGLENCVARNLLPASAGPPPAEEQTFAAAEDRKQVQADRSLTADPTSRPCASRRQRRHIAGFADDATSGIDRDCAKLRSVAAADAYRLLCLSARLAAQASHDRRFVGGHRRRPPKVGIHSVLLHQRSGRLRSGDPFRKNRPDRGAHGRHHTVGAAGQGRAEILARRDQIPVCRQTRSVQAVRVLPDD